MKKILFVVLTRLKYDTNRCNIFGFGCSCGSGEIFATEIIKYTISIYASSAPQTCSIVSTIKTITNRMRHLWGRFSLDSTFTSWCCNTIFTRHQYSVPIIFYHTWLTLRWNGYFASAINNRNIVLHSKIECIGANRLLTFIIGILYDATYLYIRNCKLYAYRRIVKPASINIIIFKLMFSDNTIF